jgi:uncharacterized protein YgbK (DUF1537 family)
VVLIGCIADDFTGATDLAGMLVKAGFRTVQTVGVPDGPTPADIDAVVVALKSRTSPPEQAVRESLAALRWLQGASARQIYFKYCSTFDSTPRGNIGPVADALLDALRADFTVVCPAFPANARTIYKGYLFVGNVLLSESGMRDHPLTPMTDANLVRVMAAQTARSVGLVPHEVVRGGAAAIRARFDELRRAGVTYAVVDALHNDDLLALGAACADLPLVTAGSGLALGLGPNVPDALPAQGIADRLPATGGRRAVISGSCSVATRRQVALMRERHPAFRVVASDLARGEDVVGRALAWASGQDGPVLIYATAEPDEVRAAQAAFGAAEAGEMVERALAAIATGLVDAGVGQMIVAGGETSGAVVQALGIDAMTIGPEIDPGVPWTAALRRGGGPPLALALKSGNFGTEDFFLKAWSRLD